MLFRALFVFSCLSYASAASSLYRDTAVSASFNNEGKSVIIDTIKNMNSNFYSGSVILIGDYFKCDNISSQRGWSSYYRVLYNESMKGFTCPIESMDIVGTGSDLTLEYNAFFKAKRAPSVYELFSNGNFGVKLFVSHSSDFSKDVGLLDREMQKGKVDTGHVSFFIILCNTFKYNKELYNYKLFNEMVTSGQILGIVSVSEATDYDTPVQNIFIRRIKAPLTIKVTEPFSGTFDLSLDSKTQRYEYRSERLLECSQKLCYIGCGSSDDVDQLCLTGLGGILRSNNTYRHFFVPTNAIKPRTVRQAAEENTTDGEVDGGGDVGEDESTIDPSSSTTTEPTTTTEPPTTTTEGVVETTTLRNVHDREDHMPIYTEEKHYPNWFVSWLKYHFINTSKHNIIQQGDYDNFMNLANPYVIRDDTYKKFEPKLRITHGIDDISLLNFYKCYAGIIAHSEDTKCLRYNIRIIRKFD